VRLDRHVSYPLVILALVTLALASCGRKAGPAPERRSPFPTGLYETVWVNPQIVLSDSLITLIRAERIDSLPAQPSGLDEEKPPVLGFAFTEPTCDVTVNLVDSHMQLVYPLLLQNLPAGFYKVTLNPMAIRKPSLPSGVYFLRAEYCERIVTAPFTVN
jgi:hypothetical protein